MEVGACPLVFSGLGSGGRQPASLPSRASELSSPRWRGMGGARGRGAVTLASSPLAAAPQLPALGHSAPARSQLPPPLSIGSEHRPAQAPECPQPGLPIRHHRPYTDPDLSDGYQSQMPEARFVYSIN